MDLKPLIPPGLVERIVGLSGLQKAYFGVQNAGRNVTCRPQGPLLAETRTPGQVAARINGDVSKGRHHTVTICPTREYAPPQLTPTQILQPSPLVARIRFGQDGCWTEVDVDVKRGINVTVPAAMIEIILHNEGPVSTVNIEGVETVGRIIDAAVFIDEMPYFKRMNATRTIVFPTIDASSTTVTQRIPAFAMALAGATAGPVQTLFNVFLQFLDENGNVVGESDGPASAARVPIAIPNGAVGFRLRNSNAFPVNGPLATVWELAF